MTITLRRNNNILTQRFRLSGTPKYRTPLSVTPTLLHAVLSSYEGVFNSFRSGRLEGELQMVYSSLPLGAVVSLFCEPF
jgi:hypothetical protein